MEKIKKYWVLTAVIILINIIGYLTLKGETLLYLSNLLPVFCSLIAIICIVEVVRALKVLDYTKIAWLLILGGLIFDFLAEGTYSFLEIVKKWDMNKNFPSYADFFWFTAAILFIVSLVIMLTGYLKSGLPLGKIRTYLLLVIILAGVIILMVDLLLIPILKDKNTELTTKAATLFYPISDTVIVGLAAILMLIVNQFNKIVSMPWKLLGLGYLFFTISDMVYNFMSWNGTYNSGNLIDLGWNCGYLLVGISGLYQLKLMNSVKERR